MELMVVLLIVLILVFILIVSPALILHYCKFLTFSGFFYGWSESSRMIFGGAIIIGVLILFVVIIAAMDN